MTSLIPDCRRLWSSVDIQYLMYVCAFGILTFIPRNATAVSQLKVLSAPRDLSVNVGSSTELTCIVGETSGLLQQEVPTIDMYWIITWDSTASVQRVQADKSGKIIGFHYGTAADRGEYVIEYQTDTLTSTDGDCSNVIHTSMLRILNATARDAGTFACGNERQKGTLSVVEITDTDDLDGCSVVIIIIGLIMVVGWCLAIVEFGVVMYMCLQKPKHAARRRNIVRRVSILLPQSKRAAYEIRESKKREQQHRRRRARAARDEEDMVQQVPRLFERSTLQEQFADSNKRRAPTSEDKNELYVNLTNRTKERAYEQKTKSKNNNKLVTFKTNSGKKNKNKKPVRKTDHKASRQQPSGKQPGSGKSNGKRKPESLAIVKPFGESKADEANKLDLYMNYPSLQRNKHAHNQSEKYAESLDSSELVSTPL